ncbi:MAG: hypothetical protein AB7G75_29520 [Candidatus Binatia bacterium]
MEDRVEDIIIDVVTGGRTLLPTEIPAAVSAEIDAALAHGEPPTEIHCDGVRYLWFIRPCVYP